MKPILFTVSLCLLTPCLIEARCITYEPPAFAAKSGDFELSFDQQPVFVEKFENYQFAHFSFDGTGMIEITCAETVDSVSISPLKYGIHPTVSGKKITFPITQSETDPAYLIVRVNDLGLLCILGDPVETDEPTSTDDGTYDITKAPYHADSSGTTDVTGIIQQAIDDASGKDGIVYLPEGVYQVAATLKARSRMKIYLAGGARLRSSGNRDDFAVIGKASKSLNPVLLAEDVSDFTLYGRGIIDANGLALMAPDGGDYRRRLFTCDGVNRRLTIKGVILHNATTWTCVPKNADDVLVKNIKVINHFDQDRVKIQNDGINLYSCTNSVVDQCFVITGDDAFCAKQGNERKPGTHLIFKNSVLFTRCAGNKVGMQSRSPANDIRFINNTIVSCRRGIVIEMDSGREGSSNIHFGDITVEKFYLPKGMSTMRPIDFLAEKAPVSNVEVTNVTFLDDPKSKKNTLEGFSHGISNVTFKNLRFEKEVITSLDQGNIKTGGITSGITFEK